jgi:hypothetical protein
MAATAGGLNMSTKSIEEQLNNFEPSPSPRFYRRMSRAAWTPAAINRRRTYAVAWLVLALAAALLIFTPQGRAWAQEVLHFFTRAESDTLPYTPPTVAWVDLTPSVPVPTMTPSALIAPFAVDCGDYQSPKCSTEQIRSKVDFKVSELGSIPAGLYFIGATGGPDRIFIKYEAEAHSGVLTIFESPWMGSPEQTAWPVGASAVVETVQIGSVKGEYVKGSFMLIDGEASVNWDPNLDIQTLHWVDKGVFFEMQVAGSAAQISRDAFATLARSLTTKTVAAASTSMPVTATPETIDVSSRFPLSVSQAEEQAGFHVLEPSRLPAILLPPVGASYEPEHHIVLIVYPVDPVQIGLDTSEGLALSQQPIGNNVDCELCGFVVGDLAAADAAYPLKVVGDLAAIEPVQIGDSDGEYVEGMWEGREGDTAMKWYAEPLVKILRWQANGMAFELTCWGGFIEKADLIAIAESMK